MKTLFLTDWYLPHAGGSRVYYHNLLANMVEQFPNEVTILTKKVPGWEEFDQRESKPSLRIVRQGMPLLNTKVYQLPRYIPTLTTALGLALQEGVRIVHAGDLQPQGLIALLLKRLLGLPYVAYCHSEEVTQMEQFRFQPLIRDRIYREADAVVAACEFARKLLLQIGVPEERIHKINPGVDWARFSPRPRNPELVHRFSLEGKKVLLTVSRLCARKGHDMVMKSIARIAAQVPNVRYLIAGRGPEEARLRQLAADLNLNPVVEFVGFVSEADLPEYYGLCDLFVMPNREEGDGDIEGFGMVFLEAAAAGKAVVAGKSGGTEDSVVDGITGLLVNPENVAELADAFRRLLLDDTLRNKLGEAGMNRARTEFDWAVRARQLEEVNRAVMAHHGAARERVAKTLAVLPAGTQTAVAIRQASESTERN